MFLKSISALANSVLFPMTRRAVAPLLPTRMETVDVPTLPIPELPPLHPNVIATNETTTTSSTILFMTNLCYRFGVPTVSFPGKMTFIPVLLGTWSGEGRCLISSLGVI